MNEEPLTNYYWKVFFRNDKMGFQKPYEVVAPLVGGAITEATEALREQGYDDALFAVVTVQRIREVGT